MLFLFDTEDKFIHLDLCYQAFNVWEIYGSTAGYYLYLSCFFMDLLVLCLF